MKKYYVIALPSSRAVRFGADWRHVAGPFDKPEALQVQKEQRGRKVYGRVFLEEETKP
jgi:hypothetical protein